MSGWHRENPHLVGTAADPWMIHDSYRRASALSDTSPPSAGQIEEWQRASAGRCADEDCGEVQPLTDERTCREPGCAGAVVEREP